MRAAVVVLTLLVLSPIAAHAQELRPVAPVFVTHTDEGTEVSGRLLDLSPETVSLLVGETRRDLPIDRVLRIDVRGDSLKNGALTGALIMGVWTGLAAWRGGIDSGYAVFYTTMNASLGAAVGASIDAMIPGRTTIYRKGTGSQP